MIKREIIIVNEMMVRDSVAKDEDCIYLFGENALRTSGSNIITPSFRNNVIDSMYRGKKYPDKTQAVIRGLHNAYPITTKLGNREGEYYGFDWTTNKEVNGDERILDRMIYKSMLYSDVERIKGDFRLTIKVPAAGFATGRAVLPSDFLEILEDHLFELGIKTKRIPHPFVKGYKGLVPVE